MNPITGRLTMSNMAAAWLLAPCETGLLSGRLVAVVTVCSGRECIDCVPHSLLLLLPAPQSVPPEFYTSPPGRRHRHNNTHNKCMATILLRKRSN